MHPEAEHPEAELPTPLLSLRDSSSSSSGMVMVMASYDLVPGGSF
jgi:hypothetical protein